MKRDIDRLARKEYDILIVGGGIHGMALAREAALRGLAVAVIDKQDFGAATSANTLKIIHGGLRYLQQLNFSRLRQSVRERRMFLQSAPHLVHPLPCAMPTRGHMMKGREALFLGLLTNDCLGWDRNRGVAPDQAIPRGRIGSRSEWLAIAPELDDPHYTGVALWHDALAYSTERLGLGLLQGATQAGADAANYLEATEFQRRGRRIEGLTAVDRMNGRRVAIRAKLCIINTGPWTRQTMELPGCGVACPRMRMALAMNLVLRRQLIPRYAVGLTAYMEGWKTGRLFFFVPWRGRTMVGTYMRLHEGDADLLRVDERDRTSFLSIVNQAYPGAHLGPDDIAMVHAGLLPAEDKDPTPGADPRLLDTFRIIDHAEADGVDGLMTVLGVKYTTARDVARRALGVVNAKFGGHPSHEPPAERPLPGGDRADSGRLVEEAVKAGVSGETARHLVRHYGTEYRAVFDLGANDPGLRAPLSDASNVIGAEVVHGMREEMALTLADVALRRTELGSAGLPDDTALRNAALLMARELGWDDARVGKEIETVKGLPNRWGR